MSEAKFLNCDTNELDVINVEGQAVYVVEILKPNTHETDSIKVFLSYEDALKTKEATSDAMPVSTFVINTIGEITESDGEIYRILPPEEVKKGDTVYIYNGDICDGSDLMIACVSTKKFTDEEIEELNRNLTLDDDSPFPELSKNYVFVAVVE